MQKIILLLLSLVMVGCNSLIWTSKALPVFPQSLNVIELSDGGICLDRESAEDIAEFKVLYESIR